jgi:hypothetical protein
MLTFSMKEEFNDIDIISKNTGGHEMQLRS